MNITDCNVGDIVYQMIEDLAYLSIEEILQVDSQVIIVEATDDRKGCADLRGVWYETLEDNDYSPARLSVNMPTESEPLFTTQRDALIASINHDININNETNDKLKQALSKIR